MKNDKDQESEKSAKGEKSGKSWKRGAAESFEELHVYQRARELTNGIYRATREGPFARDYGLVDQIRRAGASIMSNIAEGFERGATTEFIQFLYIAKGSHEQPSEMLVGYLGRQARLQEPQRRLFFDTAQISHQRAE